jgi:hypothetical protein
MKWQVAKRWHKDTSQKPCFVIPAQRDASNSSSMLTTGKTRRSGRLDSALQAEIHGQEIN